MKNEKAASLGAFLAILRKDASMTQREMAEKLNVSDKTVSHWECDESSPDISLLPAIADLFGISIDELLRCEKREETDTGNNGIKRQNEPTKQASEQPEKRFRTLNIILSVVTIVSYLCVILVLELLKYVLALHAGTRLLVSASALILTMTLTVILRLTVKTDSENEERWHRINRVTVCNGYLSLGGFALCCMIEFSSYYPWISFIAAVTAAYGLIILLCEMILRRMDILKKSAMTKEKKALILLRVLTVMILIALNVSGYGMCTNFKYARNDIIFAGAEKLSFSADQVEEFREYMAQEKTAEATFDFGYGYTNHPLDEYPEWTLDVQAAYERGDYPESEINFIWNNGEVAKWDLNSHDNYDFDFPIEVYTHEALLNSQAENSGKIMALTIGLFLYFPVVNGIVIGLYVLAAKKIRKKFAAEKAVHESFSDTDC
ncbi:MAG: helix-turn-helix transcriptional regulator [Oscillospiraceae bacterium]|nr:helix-turn-helix transcriptional regulator [Oscillospiraceae bacterium]